MTLATPREPTVRALAEIRSDFPALSRRHNGWPVAYFDGPGGTQVPRAVVSAMADYLFHHNANTHWHFPTSAETDALLLEARHALADFLEARPSEVSFGANMTTLTFHVARALGRAWKPGDSVVITELDHHANVAPWRALERERGISIDCVPLIVETGQLDWAELERLLSRGPRLLAIGAASNALGTINDVARAATLAREAGALSFVDAVHFAAHEPVDVRAIGCDFLACSAYKFYGPHIGVLYTREEVLQRLDVPKLVPAPDVGPERIETGTLNHEGIVGAAAAVDYLASLTSGQTRRARVMRTLAELRSRGQALLRRLWAGLEQVHSVRLYGPRPESPRTPTLAFTLAGYPAKAVARSLAERGIFVSTGDFYATTVVQRLAVSDGLVRIGCACYTTDAEIDRVIEAVKELAA